MPNNSLQSDYQYFLDNQEKLRKDYPGKFVVIKDKQVIGAFDDQVEAFTVTTEDHEPGTFIIQSTAPDDTTPQVFHSRVITVK